jgi:hypothetical protein
VAGRAINLKAFPTAFERFARYCDRKSDHQVGANFASIKRLVGLQMAPRNRVRNQRSRSHIILTEEIARRQRFARRLVKHVATTTGRYRR